MDKNPNNRQRPDSRPIPKKRDPGTPVKNERPVKGKGEYRRLLRKGDFGVGIALLAARLRGSVRGLWMYLFYSRDRVLCGLICALFLMLFAVLQNTLFSSLRPFGGVPDLMISFTLAVAVSEGYKWGAVWGIAAAVVIEALGVPYVTLLPLLYMPVGFFGGILCQYYFTGGAAVRTVLTLALLPIKGVFTWIYMTLSPLYATPEEIFFGVILPEAAATLLLAAPVHLLIFLCLKPFHHTRAEMVSEK